MSKQEFEAVPRASRFRCVASQVIACMAPSFLLLDLGMAFGFSTIALPDLLNSTSTDDLTLTKEQASWFGSLVFLAQPIGALFSGPLVDYLGRQKANFFVNIPHLTAWILMYFAWNVPVLFLANGLLGFSNGLLESINSYIGEVTEPSVRSSLFTVTQLFPTIGMFFMYFLGIVVTWRQAAIISLVAPITCMLWVTFRLAPESPVWLLVKHRQNEALKSLCFLRGWTKPENVQEEFEELMRYSKKLQKCVLCHRNGDEEEDKDCIHKQHGIFKRFVTKIRFVLLGKETLRPFCFIIGYFAFVIMGGLAPIGPNMVNVCNAFGMAHGGKEAVLMVGIIMFSSRILVAAFINILGKRKLAISAMLGAAAFSSALSYYAKTSLDEKVFSYNPETFPENTSYTPLILFYFLAVFIGFAIPWVMFGEIFPFRSRAIAQGLAAASNYIMTFIASKTFLNLENSLHLWGTFLLYGIFSFIGTIYLYVFLPETEGKTLQEIEDYYNGDFRTFADDPVINKIKNMKKNNKS